MRNSVVTLSFGHLRFRPECRYFGCSGPPWAHVRDFNLAHVRLSVGTQRAFFELKYFKIVKMRDAKYSLKMAAEKWRQIFPFLNALYS